MQSWIVFDGEITEVYPTRETAMDVAEECIRRYAEEASDVGEWAPDVTKLVVACVSWQAAFVPTGEPDTFEVQMCSIADIDENGDYSPSGGEA